MYNTENRVWNWIILIQLIEAEWRIHHWFMKWLVAYPVPFHLLDQCCHIELDPWEQTNKLPDVTIKMQHFPFTNVGMRVKMSSVKWWTFKYIYMLTHCGLTTPYGDIGLGQHCLTAPNQKYLNRYWLLISYLIWHSSENNFTSTAWATIRYN